MQRNVDPLKIMTEIFENLKISVNEPLPGGGNGSAYLSTSVTPVSLTLSAPFRTFVKSLCSKTVEME